MNPSTRMTLSLAVAFCVPAVACSASPGGAGAAPEPTIVTVSPDSLAGASPQHPYVIDLTRAEATYHVDLRTAPALVDRVTLHGAQGDVTLAAEARLFAHRLGAAPTEYWFGPDAPAAAPEPGKIHTTISCVLGNCGVSPGGWSCDELGCTCWTTEGCSSCGVSCGT